MTNLHSDTLTATSVIKPSWDSIGMQNVSGQTHDSAVFAIGEGVLCTNCITDYLYPCTKCCWPTTNSNIWSIDISKNTRLLLHTNNSYGLW
jgi:hypothetical protein